MENPLYSPSELIDLVLDGEIDHNQSSSLFTTLATDNDLQVEFHQALAIRRAMSNDVQVSAPSAEFTNALFNRAGVGIPSETSSPSFFGKIAFGWTHLAATAIVSLGIGAIATFSLGVNSPDPLVQNPNPVQLPKLYSLKVAPENKLISESTTAIKNTNKSSAVKKALSNNYSKKILSPVHTPMNTQPKNEKE